MPFKISFIGSGNVAFHLAAAFDRAGHRIMQVYSRNAATAGNLAHETGAVFVDDISRLADDADFIFICVNDDEIPATVAHLRYMHPVLAHTSGSVSLDVLKDAARYTGVFYPVQTLNAGKKVNFYEVPVCIEGNGNVADSNLKALADSVSNKVRFVNSGDRKYLHLAAVFANNFTNAMYETAADLLAQHNLSFDLLKPLIKETADKINALAPHDAQTGPARRHDTKTLETHISLLNEGSDEQKIYRLLTEVLLKRYSAK